MTQNIYFEEIPSQDPRLKRNILHDPRSRLFAFHGPAGLELESVRHKAYIGVLDQGRLGSCTGNTGIAAMGRRPFFPTLDDEVKGSLDQEAAILLYSEATKIDPFTGEYPPTDTGSNGLSIAKILHKRGWVSGYRHTFTLYDMKAALQFTPVMLGIKWWSSFYNPDSEGNVTITPGAYVAGGHEIIVDEIDMENERFGLTNSWGDEYGVNGRFFISFELMERLLNDYGDVVVLVPNTEPAPEPEPVEPEPQPEPEPEPTPTPTPSGCLMVLFGPLLKFFHK